MFANLPAAITDDQPRNMEAYDQGHGCILYRTKIPAGPAATLEAAAVHDFGFVFLDGKRVGVMDRRNDDFKVSLLPERKTAAQLDILVEADGPRQFRAGSGTTARASRAGDIGRRDVDGLAGLSAAARRRDARRLEISARPRRTAARHSGAPPSTSKHPAIRFWICVAGAKGVVWVNGHCLGRFWNIGPTQTAYVPGCWLHAGRNEIVIFDLTGPEKPELSGLDNPILDDLHPRKGFLAGAPPEGEAASGHRQAGVDGAICPGSRMQEIKFDPPARGRYFCLESLSRHGRQALRRHRRTGFAGCLRETVQPRRLDHCLCGQRGTRQGGRRGGKCD